MSKCSLCLNTRIISSVNGTPMICPACKDNPPDVVGDSFAKMMEDLGAEVVDVTAETEEKDSTPDDLVNDVVEAANEAINEACVEAKEEIKRKYSEEVDISFDGGVEINLDPVKELLDSSVIVKEGENTIYEFKNEDVNKILKNAGAQTKEVSKEELQKHHLGKWKKPKYGRQPSRKKRYK